MSRLAALQPPYAPDIQQQFDRIMRGAPPLMLFRVIAGNARAWEKFRAGSLLDRGPLSLRDREHWQTDGEQFEATLFATRHSPGPGAFGEIDDLDITLT